MLEYILPYISRRAYKFMANRGFAFTFQSEDAVQNIRVRAWDAVRKKRIPYSSSREFTSYLIAIASRETFSYVACPTKEWPAEVMNPIARRAIPTIETEMFLGEVPSALRGRVCPKMSDGFPDTTPMATKYVLDRILNGEYVSESWLKRQYGVEEPRFFLESVMIALRIALYEMRKDVYPISYRLRDTLYGSFDEEFF